VTSTDGSVTMPPPSGAKSGGRLSFGVIFLVLFLDLVGFGILFPLYPEMMTHYLNNEPGLLAPLVDLIVRWFPNASPEQRTTLFGGILAGAYSAVQFISAPFWGRMSDRIGRRPIMRLSLLASVAAGILWVFAASFNLLLLSRLVAAFFGGAAIAATAAVADVTDSPQARARGMALVGMAFGLGFILGPVIGGLSGFVLPKIEGGAAWHGLGLNPFSNVALVALALSVVNLIWAWRSFAETLPPERRGQITNQRSANPLVMFLGSSDQVRLNVTAFAHALLFAGMETTLGFLVWERLAYGRVHIGFLFAAMGLVSAAMQGLVFRRLAPRVGARPLALVGFVLLAGGFAVLALVDHAPSSTLVWAGVALLACGTGLVFPALTTLISLSADAQSQGSILGAFRSASSLGRAIGPLLAAVTYFSIAPAAPYWTGAALMIVPLLLLRGVRVGPASTAAPAHG